MYLLLLIEDRKYQRFFNYSGRSLSIYNFELMTKVTCLLIYSLLDWSVPFIHEDEINVLLEKRKGTSSTFVDL